MGLRSRYADFNKAVQSLYGNSMQLADGAPFSFDDATFEDAAQLVYDYGGFNLSQFTDPKVRKLIGETLRVIDTAISSGLPHEVPDTVRNALQNNAFIFSGFKTYHSLREVGLSLVTDKGDIKPYADFLADVRRVNATYNHNYLYAEYNHAVAASLMAAKWQDFERDGDRYDLQYRTAGDNRVREEHAILNGTTLPPSDPFWAEYLPPNGWNCRCTAVQVRKGKYPTSDPALAKTRGDNCTEGEKRKIFRFNVGKTLQVFPPKHPYYKAPKEVKHYINNLAEYNRLLKDDNYTNVNFNTLTGGMTAEHNDHNFDKVGGVYEREVQEAGLKAGHAVIFEAEKHNEYGKRNTEGTWDGLRFEVAGKQTATENNILSGLKHCASKRTTQVAILDFPNGGYDAALFQKVLGRYRGLEKLNDGQFLKFKKIICIQNKQIVYEADF